MLTFHEIANDEIKGIPIAVTYCPLCNAGIVYDRRFKIGDKNIVLDMAVSENFGGWLITGKFDNESEISY